MRVSGCYAACTNNCDGELTREHIITKALLGEKTYVSIVGKKEKVFTKNNFVVKNLCKVHNNSFRKAEAHMRHFVDFLVEDAKTYHAINTSIPSAEYKPRVFKIKGKYLENWLLKSAINYCYLLNDFEQPDFNFKYITKRLFEDKEFDEPFGLSVIRIGEQMTHKNRGVIGFDPKLDVDGEVCGVGINLSGYFFLIWLPTTNSHRLTREGLKFEDRIYKYDESIIWHGEGIVQQMFAGDGSVVTRSELLIKW